MIVTLYLPLYGQVALLLAPCILKKVDQKGLPKILLKDCKIPLCCLETHLKV